MSLKKSCPVLLLLDIARCSLIVRVAKPNVNVIMSRA